MKWLDRFKIPVCMSLMLAGCVAEDTSDCVECRLTFRYAFGSDQVGRLEDMVHHIRLYSFDQKTGVLSGVMDIGHEDIVRGWVDIDGLPDGSYTFVAWGGSSADMSGSYFGAHMTDHENHDHTDIEIGHTRLDDFYMMLDYVPFEGGAQDGGQIAPARVPFDDLFFARSEGVKVVRGERRTVDFEFIRNSSVLQVTVTGLEHLGISVSSRAPDAEEQPLRVFAVGSNGRYRWDNTIDEHARGVHYEQPCHTLTDSRMEVDIKTLRLDKERHASDPVLLYVRDSEERDLIVPLDIVRSILETRSTRGDEYIYPDQRAIDRQYEFPISVAISRDARGKLKITVSIHDWEIVTVTPDVGRPQKRKR